MKFVIINDIHECDTTPESRLDEYCDVIMAKVEACFTVANTLDAEIIIAGDIFHRKKPRDVSHQLVNRFLNIFRTRKPGRRIFGVKGNHDQSSIEAGDCKFPIDTLQIGGLELLDGVPIQVGCVSLNGLPWTEAGETDIDRLALRHINGLVPVSVFHQYLIPDNMEFAGAHMRLSKIWDKLPRVTIVGHLHDGFPGGAIENAGKVIINVGALARERMTKEALSRIPHYGMLDIEPSGLTFSWNEIPGALPSDKVFDLQKKAEVTQKIERLQKFAQDFSIKLSDVAAADLGSIDELKVLLSSMSLDTEVKETAMKFLDEACE